MPTFVPAAARTMALFELFCREKRELSNSEVARFLDMAESSSLDLLHTLQQTGYLMRTARTRRFYPTGRLRWAGQEISAYDPRTLAGQEMTDLLSDRTGETAICGLLDDGAVRIITVSQGRHLLRYVLQSGERIALHVSALGRALLAEMEPKEAIRQLRLKPLRKLTENSLTSIESIQKVIEEQRVRGWYSAQGESVPGVTALCVPGMLGDDLVGLSIAGPSERFAANHDAYLAALMEISAASLRSVR